MESASDHGTEQLESKLSIDTSDLLRVSVDYGRLEVILSQVVRHVDDVKSKNTELENRIKDLEKRPQAAELRASQAQVETSDECVETNVSEVAPREKNSSVSEQQDDGGLPSKVRELEERIASNQRDVNAALDSIGKKMEALSVVPTAGDQPTSADVNALRRDLDLMRDKAKQMGEALSAQGDKVAKIGDGLTVVQATISSLKPSSPADAGKTEDPFSDTLRLLLDRLTAIERGQEERDQAVEQKLQALTDQQEQLGRDLKNCLDAAEMEHEKLHALYQQVQSVPVQQSPPKEYDAVIQDIISRLEILEKDKAQVAAEPTVNSEIQTSTDLTPDAIEKIQGQVDQLKQIVNDLQNPPVKPKVVTEELSKPPVAEVRQQTSPDMEAFMGETRRHISVVQEGQDNLKAEIKVLGSENSSLAEQVAKLANQFANLQNAVDSQKETKNTPRKEVPPPIQLQSTEESKAWRDKINSLCSGLQDAVNNLDAGKLEKNALTSLSFEIADIRRQLSSVVKATTELTEKDARGKVDELSRDMEAKMNDMLSEVQHEKNWTKAQVVEIRAVIEHIHHSKADASLVANKAEREYVENALEKLMREVEQVLNTTNAGLIDTLDKSLNILRDMIDGKATKQDVLSLKGMMGEESSGTVPDGLAGFKGYRCLGCNRTMDNMRSRPMGSSFSPFMNRLPTSPRAPNKQQVQSSPTQSPVGYLTAPPN